MYHSHESKISWDRFSSQSLHVHIVGMVYSRRFRFGVLGTMVHGYGVVLGGNLFYARNTISRAFGAATGSMDQATFFLPVALTVSTMLCEVDHLLGQYT
jgi:hypothetical protein